MELRGGDILCCQASLFTYVNKRGIAPTMFKVDEKGIPCAGFGGPNCGPTFGSGFDLYISVPC